MCYILCFLVWCLTPSLASGAVKELTEKDFYDFVLDTNVNVFVEFYSDVTSWSQDFAPVYERLANVFQKEKHCVVAKVNVNKYRQLGKIYEWGGFMKFWFFASHIRQDGVLYEGGRSLQEMVNFLNEKCGTNRRIDGELDVNKGRDESYDNLASLFIEAATKGNGSTNDIGAYYVNTMKKITEQGMGYVGKELQRLNKILKEYMKTEKRRSMISRLNVLKFFQQRIEKEDGQEMKDIVEEKAEESAGDQNDSNDGKESHQNSEGIIKNVLNGGPTSGNINLKEL